MNDIMKVIQALEDSDILLKGLTKTIKNETKEQKGGFSSMLLRTLGATLLGNFLTGKGILGAGSGNKKKNKKGKGIVSTLDLDEYANVGAHWIVLICKKKMKLFISIVLVLNIFLTKLKNLLKNFLEIKI